MRYVIMGRYGNNREEIDEANSQEEADKLADEYRLAFGEQWVIWVKKAR